MNGMWITDFLSQFTSPKRVLSPLKHNSQVISNHKNNSYNLLGTSYMPGTILHTSGIVSHLIWIPSHYTYK